MNSSLNHIWNFVLFILFVIVIFGLLMIVSYFFYKQLAQVIKDAVNNTNFGTEPYSSKQNQFVKRAFDIVFSYFALFFVCFWLFPVICILIKIDSKGPVIYKQRRIGRKGKEFYVYKFRTLRVRNIKDEKTIFRQASANDVRITKTGRFLRSTSLDKLPMLINVLYGDMTIIGRSELYSTEQDIETKKLPPMIKEEILNLKPGLISLYSISKDNIDFNDDDLYKYDIYYVHKKSFLFDIKILLAFFVILYGLGTKY